MKYLALTLPGSNGTPIQIQAPQGVPTGGLVGTGQNILQTVITVLFLIAIVMALFYLIYGGFQWMTSGGDQEKLGGARQTMLYAVIGMVVVALSFTVINLIDTFLHPAQCLLCLFKSS
ncbi:MAG TPA: hypothetical protein VLF89_04160 [Candidatus Saccharimonadales bacterium]|nr:hypothetical protein [Candidatus Saccharimonadales bacterium]